MPTRISHLPEQHTDAGISFQSTVNKSEDIWIIVHEKQKCCVKELKTIQPEG